MKKAIFAAAYGSAMADMLLDYTERDIDPSAAQLAEMIDLSGQIAKVAAENAPRVRFPDEQDVKCFPDIVN